MNSKLNNTWNLELKMGEKIVHIFTHSYNVQRQNEKKKNKTNNSNV